MLKATMEIAKEYGAAEKKEAAELAKKTLEQIHREYLEAVFTAACRRRLDLWDFAQKFMESRFSLALDRPKELMQLDKDEIFRDFMISCAKKGVSVEYVIKEKAGMEAFRTLPPAGRWLAELYSKWHAKTGEASCEIAERAPAAMLKKISKKAMLHQTDQIIALLLERSAEKE
ncbi:MAG: hypothetical protein RR091_09405 [Cloacibacillus sp.]